MIMVPYGWPGPSLQLTGEADFWHPTGRHEEQQLYFFAGLAADH